MSGQTEQKNKAMPRFVRIICLLTIFIWHLHLFTWKKPNKFYTDRAKLELAALYGNYTPPTIGNMQGEKQQKQREKLRRINKVVLMFVFFWSSALGLVPKQILCLGVSPGCGHRSCCFWEEGDWLTTPLSMSRDLHSRASFRVRSHPH